MTRIRRLSITPGTAIALIALFFALGGSAFAVGERIQAPSVAQQRCANGAVRGIAVVTGIASQGIANFPDSFTGCRKSLRPEVQLHRKGSSGQARRDGRLRGPVRRDLRGEWCRQRHGRRVRDGASGAGRRRSESPCIRLDATTRSISRSRSSSSESYGRRGETNAPIAVARRSSAAAMAMNSHVISL